MRLDAPVVDAARSLLGSVVVHGDVAVRLTEVEAYDGVGLDPGSHAHRGRTPRNAVMFGPAGRAYVYLSYGMHWCLNVVTGPDGAAAAVLLRAGEVVSGHEVARERRPGAPDAALARGPALLCRALAVTGELGGVDLLNPTSPLRLVPGTAPDRTARGPRVGVSGEGAATPWRFWVDGHPTVSRYRAAARGKTPPPPTAFRVGP